MRPGLLAALLLLAGSAHAQEPAFREGDVLGYADVAKLEPFLPAEFWAHRELFFYEGMQLEIGPTQRDYSPAQAYVAATTARMAGRVSRIGTAPSRLIRAKLTQRQNPIDATSADTA